MTVSTAGDPSDSTSAAPVSFARLGWQLATLEPCAQCDRRTSTCVGCVAALDELIVEERLQHAINLFGQVAAWKNAGLLSASAALRLWRTIEQTTPANERSWSERRRPIVAVAGTSRTQSSPTGAAVGAVSGDDRPLPQRRPFGWRDLGESLLAERTLNTLLALGAFLILASALVISVLNPTKLPLVPHLAVLAGAMTLFYAAGYVCYARMRLTRAGETLLAIAAAFVPLDVWVVSGADGLGWSRAETWAVASAVALPVYGLSYALLPGRAFAWLSAIAGQSLLLASLNLTATQRDWVACASVVLGNVYIVCSTRLRSRRWTSLGTALFRVAHVVTPVAMLLLLAAKFNALPWAPPCSRPIPTGCGWST
jgi:hypothetical protein